MINIINDWQFDMNIIKNMSPYAAVNYIIKVLVMKNIIRNIY